jgi:hypothetical protein
LDRVILQIIISKLEAGVLKLIFLYLRDRYIEYYKQTNTESLLLLSSKTKPIPPSLFSPVLIVASLATCHRVLPSPLPLAHALPLPPPHTAPLFLHTRTNSSMASSISPFLPRSFDLSRVDCGFHLIESNRCCCNNDHSWCNSNLKIAKS